MPANHIKLHVVFGCGGKTAVNMLGHGQAIFDNAGYPSSTRTPQTQKT